MEGDGVVPYFGCAGSSPLVLPRALAMSSMRVLLEEYSNIRHSGIVGPGTLFPQGVQYG
jgi:hypothetical protein